MSDDYSTRSVCVVDNGLFVEFAVLLAKSFGKVRYFSPWVSAFPKSNELLVGQGLPGVERVESLEDEDVLGSDLFVFPDVYQGPLQEYLASIGKRVWGSRRGEELELYRHESKQHLRKLGLSVGPYVVITGLDALRAHLQQHDRQYVKISKTRGDTESFRSENYALIEPRLDELEHALGAKKKLMQFIVEDAIDDAVEVGYDGYTVDGQWPTRACAGIEVKDQGYLGHFQRYADMPSQIRDVNAALADTLKRYEYRNFLSVEMRITKDGVPWVIDPCARAGSPPSELLQVMYRNLPDIFWHGAAGECVDPDPAAEWGAELLLLSPWADKNWQAVAFPEQYRDNVKLRNLTIIDGKYYVVPQSVGLPEIGAVVAVGQTPEEACANVRTIADTIEGYFIEVPSASLDAAKDEMAKLAQMGISL